MTKNVITKNITVEEVTYIANDGKTFENEDACRIYENKMASEVEDAKFDRMFVPISEALTSWINDGIWYKVVLTNEDDVIDFFTLSNARFSDHFYDGEKTRQAIVNEYMNMVRNDKPVELLLYTDCDSYYLSRYEIICTKEETYNSYLNRVENISYLAKEMKKQIRFIPENK